MSPDDLPDRFRQKFTVAPSGCWIWLAAKGQGYGQYRPEGKLLSAHRFAYEYLIGPIPDGLQLDHLCRVRACVNPLHLEPVTQRVNLLRGRTIQARNAAKTHCPQGHPYDPAMTYVTPQGHRKRRCRPCVTGYAA